ncbi:hypothetical protein [uncultured Thiodictyon sp.]|uniref:hypothetical protein n=1 Tax=uncultured Thiodictyon sp. TaxID=1846217 RepID=UPI0025D9559F|nr:hypothetical protein [uncultured Thiodictyon sp.]
MTSWLRLLTTRAGHWMSSLPARQEPRGRATVLWSALALVLALLIAVLTLLAPRVDQRLDPGRLAVRTGQAFEVALGRLIAFPFAVTGDALYSQHISRLEVLEDGHPLGPAHSLHQTIATAGGGAYSHWGKALILSTSDGSDPRTNGRDYRVRAQAGAHPALWWLLLTATTVAVYLFVYHSEPRRFRRAFLRLDDDSGLGCTAAFAITGSAAAVFLLLRDWEAARTISVSAAGFLPLSDAIGYWNCASEIAARGELTQNIEWCGKRLTYTTFLAAVLGLTNWHPHLMYLAQALVVGLAVAGLALQVARLTGLAGGTLVAATLLAYANEQALGVTMTEVAGLTAGATGLALLLHGAERARPLALAAGLALLSVAQVSRSGAMLILPAVVLWVVLMAPRLGLRRWTAVGVAILALSSGFVLQHALAQSLHVKAGASFGNFSLTLYGLSVGGEGWQQAYKDYPELFRQADPSAGAAAAARAEPGAPQRVPPGYDLSGAYRQVYTLAFANILRAPDVFFGACLRAAGQYPHSMFEFVPGSPQSVWYLNLLLIMGIAWCLYHWRSPVNLLLLAAIAGEATSAPLIIEDGGIRLFAGSIGLRVVLAALGLRAASTLLWPRQMALAQRLVARSGWARGTPVLAVATATALIGLSILPATGLLAFARLPVVAAPACPAGEEQIVTRFDRESATLTLALDEQASGVFPLLVVRPGALLANMDGTWFAPDFAALKPGVTIVNALRREPHDFGHARGLLLEPRPAWLTPGTLVRACAAPDDFVSIASRNYLRARSLEPVQTQGHGE